MLAEPNPHLLKTIIAKYRDNMAFLTQDQLNTMGFKSLGKNVLISDKASIYGAEHISIGDNSRIDDFCILSAGENPNMIFEGGIRIGRYVHIGCYSSLIGKAHIRIEDYAGLSGRVSVYSSSDPYDGSHMTNPTVPEPYRLTENRPVTIGKHSVIGTGTVILPGSFINDYSCVGAMSLVKGHVMGMSMYAGVPAKDIGARDADSLIKIEKEMEEANGTA